jgi:hypothetical protein
MTIGTSFTHLWDTHTLALELPTGKTFLIRILMSGPRRLLTFHANLRVPLRRL